MNVDVKRILVGIDGSDSSRHALSWAVAVAQAFGAEVIAVHAVGLLTHLDPGPPVPSQGHRDEIRRAFEEDWSAELAASGVSHQRVILDGSPVPAVLDAAEEWAADLVVVGNRGLGGFPELLLGSTSHQLAQHAHRPVLIVAPREQGGRW
jgi:nucleotide-binding universal stress UspA family protein